MTDEQWGLLKNVIKGEVLDPLPIGFIIAVLSLYFSAINPSNFLSNFAMPVMLLLVPIFDTTNIHAGMAVEIALGERRLDTSMIID